MSAKSKHKNKKSASIKFSSSNRKVAFNEARVRIANECSHPELQLEFFRCKSSHTAQPSSTSKDCYLPFNSKSGQLFLAHFSQWDQVSDQEFDAAFSLFVSNMKSLYEKTQWLGWTPDKRRAEMREPNARYIFVRPASDCSQSSPELTQTSSDAAQPEALAAFVHYRFDMDYDRAVLYLYELQVNSIYRRSGIGSWIVTSIIEPLAALFHMQRVK